MARRLAPFAFAIGVLACTGAPESQPAPPASAPAASAPATGAARIGTAPAPEPELTGFTMPIPGGCLPKSDRLMPNAPRTYRKGVHEGIDFYHSDNCTPITRGTPVVAAKGGRVARVDTAYVDVTRAQVDAYLADPNTDASLDQFRGRQVWIDHGNGVITRYCHLSGVAPGVSEGMTATAGLLIGFVGESGTPSSVRKPGREYHLHFELRVNGVYLGRDLPPARVRAIYRDAFGLRGK